ncbi:MAG: hypothetical protein ACLFNU_05860 [Bacteroidales bacterium]
MRKQIFIYILLIPLILICLSFNNNKRSIDDGRGLIRKIYKTHSDSWYSNLTFKQEMFRYRDDSLIGNEVWLVAYSASGNLHIRYEDFDSGRGWLITNDTLYTFNHDKLIGEKPRLHDIMTLGLDIFITPPADIIGKIESMGFDLSLLAKTTIKGNKVFQVGDPDDQCFWIYEDELLFYGLRRVDKTGVKEIFFEKYETFYDKPVATQIQYFQDGEMYLLEKYFDVRMPSCLPDDFFDPDLFNSTRW